MDPANLSADLGHGHRVGSQHGGNLTLFDPDLHNQYVDTQVISSSVSGISTVGCISEAPAASHTPSRLSGATPDLASDPCVTSASDAAVFPPPVVRIFTIVLALARLALARP